MPWQPRREPLRSVLLRTGLIAFAVGAIARSPRIGFVALWPALGGHFVEWWFLNWLRPRLSDTREVHAAARVATWLVGGVLLTMGMQLSVPSLPLWLGAAGFMGIELIVHLGMALFRRPNFYDGRG